MLSLRPCISGSRLPVATGPVLVAIEAIPCIVSRRAHGNLASQRQHSYASRPSSAPLQVSQFPSCSKRPIVKSLVPPRWPGSRALHTASATREPVIHHVFEAKTGTWQYIVADPSTHSAVIIDPVLDYDPATQEITTQAADGLLSLIKEKGYTVQRILETHAHADHLTAASYLQKKLSEAQGFKPPIGIGKRIGQVQNLFSRRYGIDKQEYDVVFDKLFEDDEEFSIGELTAKAIHLPGHTPDHLGYHIGNNVFCGDSLFHADIGTARCDFPGGNARDLFRSGQKLLALDEQVKIWPGHDYPPEPRGSPVPWMTVGDHKKQNKHLGEAISEEEFIAMREERDAKLAAPRLLHQSLQVNIRGGHLPQAGESGHRMLHLPLKLNGLEW
ncbi:hypothetical protein N7468_007122 [Penicillium chermesinum]|uniref:Metallo-beta-lactamase domain-containing protein n=1 Tax=Penicillium chermesinum TaxID=63820 RepID=A0A9W9NTH1_9EURO|nr:uncharacterized protein N7468_007122 [Penicillium chermesinum]KAJ5225897.1 hypothetical protein N7468_007122 [Penicillium chermesinum]KAJ6160897.1 hypothetical protein N7470_004293 [Penicillium chermesinum]